MNRRNLLQVFGAVTASPALHAASALPLHAAPVNRSASYAPQSYGARVDGRSNDRVALQAAIDACTAAGGGIVYLAPGVYLTGTIVLKSNVTLYLEAGATLLGSTNISDYLPQPGPEPGSDAGEWHLVFARKATNIAICGMGTIDGQGSTFWRPTHRRTPTASERWADVATRDWKPVARPSPMVEIVECANVHLRDVTLTNSAGWTLRPIASKAVLIDGIRILNPIYGPNVDGIDVTCCEDVFISNCLIRTADDAICLKSDSPYGDPTLTRNVVITNCMLSSCCNGLKFGTSTQGGFENITFSNSVIANEEVSLEQRVISGIALEVVDGGWIDGVTITGIQMQRVRTPIFLRRGNRWPRPDGTPGPLRNVLIDGVQACGAILTNSITGLPGFPVENITLSNIRMASDEPGEQAWVSRTIPEVARDYPEARMFGRLPAYGLYCRHVAGLRLRDVELISSTADPRPAIVWDDVRSAEMSGLRTSPSQAPAALLRNAQQIWLRDGLAAAGCDHYVGVEGAATRSILVSHSDLRLARVAVAASADVPADELRDEANIMSARRG